MFRANKKDNGELVFGYYCVIESEHYIVLNNASLGFGFEGPSGFLEVDPITIAMKTGVKAKNGEIYGSFPLDGVMTKGSSRVKAWWDDGDNDGGYYEATIKWIESGFQLVPLENNDNFYTVWLGYMESGDMEVIGTQLDGEAK